MLPIADIPHRDLKSLKAVLTDIDDTLTLHGRLPAIAYTALEDLSRAGVRVIPVTGRPAGWCDMIARQWPVSAVVGENGAFAYAYDDKARVMRRHYAQNETTRKANQAKLWSTAKRVLTEFPGTALASDQAYREIDVAIDFCEDVPALPFETADAIAQTFRRDGATAKVSSIHVNAWYGAHDKLSMAKRILMEFGLAPVHAAYLGDSPNDAPMFKGFNISIGVANIAPLLHLVDPPPKYVTAGEGGIGFAEFAALLLKAKRDV